MIKKLRRKLTLVAVCSIGFVVLAAVLAINGVNFYRIIMEADWTAENIAQNNGRFPALGAGGGPFGMTEESPFRTRYFTARVDGDDMLMALDTGHIAAVSADTAAEYAVRALTSAREAGTIDGYRFAVKTTGGDRLIVFVDMKSDLQRATALLLMSSGIGAASLAAVFLVITLLSRAVTRPVEDSYEKQRRFITDAGHELKTPLAVISANTDVLELETGDSKWLTSIRNQTRRMDALVKGLLTLSRMDEGSAELLRVPFCLSDAAEETLTAFRPLAESAGKQLDIAIEPGVTVTGSEEHIRRLIGILADNAVKYASAGGSICAELKKTGRGALLTVSNPCDEPPSGDLNRFFDRFYRADAARTTGGYGLGLSIARSIAEAHKAKLTCSASGSVITFSLLF